MAALAKLLVAGNVPQTITDDVAQQKLASQYIHRQLREADEANLIDEEDMYIFGSRPMADPLHLVSCNACKKPVKASQYAAHADLCRSLSCIEGIFLQLDGASQKKPPRKERKKLLTTHSTTSARGQEEVEYQPGKDTTAQEFLSKDHTQMNSLAEAKSSEYPARSSTGLRTFDHRNFHVNGTPSQVREPHIMLQDIPAPLATKMYYSQRTSRFRSALAHMYHQSSCKGNCIQYVSQEISETKTALAQCLVPRSISDENQQDKNDEHCSFPLAKPGRTFEQSSEFYSPKRAGEALNFSTQFPVSNALRSHSVGAIRSNFVRNSRSFSTNSDD